MSVQTTLILDEHLLGAKIGLEHRGIAVKTVADFGATSTLDPDVIRAVAGGNEGGAVGACDDGWHDR